MSSFKAGIVIGILGLAVILGGYLYLHGITIKFVVSDLYANFGIDLVGTAITVLVIDYLNDKRDEKNQKERLIRDFCSKNSELTLRAIYELKANGGKKGGWLSDGSLNGKFLVGANLSNAHLEYAKISYSDLTGSNLENGYVIHANFTNTNLSFSILRNTDFSYSILTNANLTGAIIEKTNFCGADLRFSNIGNAILNDFIYDKNTVWPEGFAYEEYKCRKLD